MLWVGPVGLAPRGAAAPGLAGGAGREGGAAAYEGYLAQVAPASAVLYHSGAVLPLEPSLPDAMEPLGLHEEFWPDFRRLDLDEGDRLLLLSPGLARALPPPDLQAALSLPAEDALPALYRPARSLSDCAAPLVAAQSPAAEEPGTRN